MEHTLEPPYSFPLEQSSMALSSWFVGNLLVLPICLLPAHLEAESLRFCVAL